MLRTWKMFALTGLSVALFLVPGRLAAQDSDKAKTPVEKRLEDLQNDLKDLKEQLKASFGGIKNDFDTLKPLLNDTLRNTSDIKGLQEDLRRFAIRLDRLQDSVKALDDRWNSTARVARAFEPQPLVALPGTIRLVNRSGTNVTIFLGSAAYPLGPYDVRLVEARPGPYTYEVFAEGWGTIQGQVTRTLGAGETSTIQINPSR